MTKKERRRDAGQGGGPSRTGVDARASLSSRFGAFSEMRRRIAVYVWDATARSLQFVAAVAGRGPRLQLFQIAQRTPRSAGLNKFPPA